MKRQVALVSGRDPKPYCPKNGGYQIKDGPQSYNRALYGKPCKGARFSVFAGDRPEWLLYHLGIAGYVFVGVKCGERFLSAAEFQHAELWYGTGLARNQATDAENGMICVETLPAVDSAAALFHIRWDSLPRDGQLCVVYGGIDRTSSDRNLDPGYTPQRDTLFSAARVRENVLSIEKEKVKVRFRDVEATLSCNVAVSACFADASALLEGRFNSAAGENALAAMLIDSGAREAYVRVGFEEGKSEENAWEEAMTHRKALEGRIDCSSSDAALDSAIRNAVSAVEGSWVEPYFLHGAWSWRIPLLGWRSRFGATLLGWGDRVIREARAYYTMMYADGWQMGSETAPQLDCAYFEPKQMNIPLSVVKTDAKGRADERYRLARQSAFSVFNSDGCIPYGPGKEGIVQYNMSEDFFTQAIYQLKTEWNEGFALETLEHLRRYLAWQDRCFNPDGDGLYENFANFWASDSIQYDGAACSLATANTFFAYCAAEKLAVKLREDPAPFAEKRKNIREAFQKTLWMQEGHPAESIDRTGEGLIHPLASLPTIVTCITSGILSEEQCESSLDYVEKCLEHVVLEDGELVYNTQWAPYQWSVRDVDFADVCHLALCCFLCGRVDKGWSLLRGVIGESCLRSVSPGAFMCVLEGKSVDFSDSSSMFVRAVVEGLFGYRPNALENTMLLAPSFPKKLKDVEWKLPAMNGYWHNNDHAIAFGFSLDGWEGKTTIRIPTERNVKRASWNGRPVPTSGGKYVEVVVDGGGELIIEWEEQTLSTVAAPVEIKQENRRKNAWDPDKWNWVPIPVEWDGKLKDFFSRKYGVRESNRCSLRLPWSLEPPTWCLRGRETIVLSDALVREKTSDGLFYACGIPFLQPHEADKPNVLYLSQWEGFPKKTEIALPAGAKGLALLIAGWTNHMQCGVPNARIVFCKADGTEEEICLMAPSDFRPLTCGPEDERPQDRSCYLRELQRVQIGTFTGTRSGKAYAQVNAFDLSENVGKARIESVSNETVIGLMGVAVGYATLSAASLRLNGGISTKNP